MACELTGTYPDNYDDLYRRAINSRSIVIKTSVSHVPVTYYINMAGVAALITPVVWHNCSHDTHWVGVMEEKRNELQKTLVEDISDWIRQQMFDEIFIK